MNTSLPRSTPVRFANWLAFAIASATASARSETFSGEVSSTVKLIPLMRAASPPASDTSSIIGPTFSMSRILIAALLVTRYPVKTCLLVRMPFSRTSVHWYCGEMLKNCVWMSMAAMPLLLRDVTIASIAVAASALATATVLPVVSTPRFSIARSGSNVTLPSPDTQMPEFPLVD